MRVLCAVGQRGGPELIRRLVGHIGSAPEYLLLHVIDTGPRHEIAEYVLGPLRRRPPHERPIREESLKAAEEEASRAAMGEALSAAHQASLKVETDIREGQPEKVIVQAARETDSDLIVIWAREGAVGRPPFGPASVGHTARYVVDHAPCDVLLLKDKGP